ncbi:unnamed protein product, partial [Ceratitis capitata]
HAYGWKFRKTLVQRWAWLGGSAARGGLACAARKIHNEQFKSNQWQQWKAIGAQIAGEDSFT